MIDDIVDKYLNEAKDVKCPTCNGDGKSPFVKKNKCMTCKGKGKIPLKTYDSLMSIRKDLKSKISEHLNEAVKSKLANGVYGKIRVIEGYKKYGRLWVHKKKGMGYMVTTEQRESLDNMVEIDGDYWFATLRELHDALNA